MREFIPVELLKKAINELPYQPKESVGTGLLCVIELLGVIDNEIIADRLREMSTKLLNLSEETPCLETIEEY